jgi:uncharacterized repeat protein (TIGR04076 family)
VFKVKAVITDMLGDREKYPCHHQHQIGDEFIYDGAYFHGHICPSFAITLVPMMIEVHAAGPRYKGYLHYYPFLYAPHSVDAPELKKYDGLGYKNIFEHYTEPPFSVANLASSITWPPPATRPEYRPVKLICPDYRTSVVAGVFAFDLSDTGRNISYFRREMVILDRILDKQGIEADKVLNEFTKEEIDGIYPALTPVMIESLLDEMAVMDYLEIRDGKVYTTPKAGPKVQDFKAGLTGEEIEALKIRH